jgi:predicted metalloendopeptidase
MTHFADIVGAFKKSLRKLDWMDQKSAIAAAEKVSVIDTRNLASFDVFHCWV